MLDSTTTVLMLIAVVFIYMLPTLIAFGREHRRRMDVTVVNILFGWTLIGWLLAIVWALRNPTERQASEHAEVAIPG